VLEAVHQGAQFLQRFFIFFGKLKQHAGIGNLGLETFLPFYLLFKDATPLQKFLGRFLVVPKLGRRSGLFYNVQFLTACGDIKETSRAALPWSATLRKSFLNPESITSRSFTLQLF
jgi:hypothetical protein